MHFLTGAPTVSHCCVLLSFLQLLWHQCKSVAALRIAYVAGVFDPLRPDDGGTSSELEGDAPGTGSSNNLLLPGHMPLTAAAAGEQKSRGSSPGVHQEECQAMAAEPAAVSGQHEEQVEVTAAPAGPGATYQADRVQLHPAALCSIVARSVIITDIPGTTSHTHLSRVRSALWSRTLARLLPHSWKCRIEEMAAGATYGAAHELNWAARAAVHAATSASAAAPAPG